MPQGNGQAALAYCSLYKKELKGLVRKGLRKGGVTIQPTPSVKKMNTRKIDIAVIVQENISP